MKVNLVNLQEKDFINIKNRVENTLFFIDLKKYSDIMNMKNIFKLRGISMTYNTKQKDLLLDVISSEKKEFTIKDIYNKLDGKVGLTTIYRFIEKLEKENLITKSVGSDNNTYYQYLHKCNHENHFYLKCNNCGEMKHIDCDCILELSDHINKHHKFIPDREKIIINGICEKCSKDVKLC